MDNKLKGWFIVVILSIITILILSPNVLGLTNVRCVQLMPNASSVGDGICGLTYSGSCTYNGTLSSAVCDSDLFTNSSGAGSIIINWSKPTGLLNSFWSGSMNLLYIKDSVDSPAFYLQSTFIPECLDNSDNFLVAKIDVTTNGYSTSCYNGSSFVSVAGTSGSAGQSFYGIYMNWTIAQSEDPLCIPNSDGQLCTYPVEMDGFFYCDIDQIYQCPAGCSNTVNATGYILGACDLVTCSNTCTIENYQSCYSDNIVQKCRYFPDGCLHEDKIYSCDDVNEICSSGSCIDKSIIDETYINDECLALIDHDYPYSFLEQQIINECYGLHNWDSSTNSYTNGSTENTTVYVPVTPYGENTLNDGSIFSGTDTGTRIIIFIVIAILSIGGIFVAGSRARINGTALGIIGVFVLFVLSTGAVYFGVLPWWIMLIAIILCVAFVTSKIMSGSIDVKGD